MRIVAASPQRQIPTPDQHAAEEQRWQILRPAAEALYGVSRDFPDDFAYSDFTETGFVVAFSGAAPEAAVDRLRATGVAFAIVTDTGYSSLDLEGEMTQISAAVVNQVGSTIDFVVEASPQAGKFTVTLLTDDVELVKRVAVASDSLRSPRLLPVEFTSSDASIQLAV